MKYLILIISLQVFADVRVVGTASKNRDFSVDFKTTELAQAWIDGNIANDSFGRKKRWVAFEGQENCLQVRDLEVLEGEEPRKECQLDKEYVITITDITEEVNAKKAERLAIKAERLEIREMMQALHSYNTVGEWRSKVNKVLRKLVKDNLKD